MNDDLVMVSDETSETGILENTIENEDGSVTIALKHPVKVMMKTPSGKREELTDSLTFRRMNGGDMRAIANHKDEMQIAITLFRRLAGIPESVFDRLDMEDIARCMGAIEDFLPDHLTIGKG